MTVLGIHVELRGGGILNFRDFVSTIKNVDTGWRTEDIFEGWDERQVPESKSLGDEDGIVIGRIACKLVDDKKQPYKPNCDKERTEKIHHENTSANLPQRWAPTSYEWSYRAPINGLING